MRADVVAGRLEAAQLWRADTCPRQRQPHPVQLHLVLADVDGADASRDQGSGHVVAVIDHQRADADHDHQFDRAVALLDAVPQVANEYPLGQPLARDAELDVDRGARVAVADQVWAADASQGAQPAVVHRELERDLGRAHDDRTTVLAACEGHG